VDKARRHGGHAEVDAPQDMLCCPPALQRAVGDGRIAVGRDSGLTRLRRLYQDGCAKIRLPRSHGTDGLEAVLLNTSGGLTGGDRLSWCAVAGTGAALTLTTQACEKVYRASGGVAEVNVRLQAGAGAHLEWLPQETILFDEGALRRRVDVELAEDATLLAVEAVVLGRQAMGERVKRGQLQDRWRVRRGQRLAFADDLKLSGDMGRAAGCHATLGGARAFASLLLIAPDADQRLQPLRKVLGPGGGASAFDGRLFARVVAPNGFLLRQVLIAALATLRGGVPPPRVWTL
jgi:urease accessory protein